MVVVELSGKEERPGEAIVLRSVVTVVLVSADGVPPETAVLPDVERQLVVVAGKYRLCVTADHQFRRMVPLKVHTEFRFWVGRPGWNLSGIGTLGSMPELKFDAT